MELLLEKALKYAVDMATNTIHFFETEKRMKYDLEIILKCFNGLTLQKKDFNKPFLTQIV